MDGAPGTAIASFLETAGQNSKSRLRLSLREETLSARVFGSTNRIGRSRNLSITSMDCMPSLANMLRHMARVGTSETEIGFGMNQE